MIATKETNDTSTISIVLLLISYRVFSFLYLKVNNTTDEPYS